ncbi:MAG: ribonuclease P protein component 1 [Candidatus Hadarchaeales archaeon]
MPITEKNLLQHELVGLRVMIAESSDPSLRGVKGVVMDESMKMLVIEDGEKLKKIPKAISTFIFITPDGKEVKVDGKMLIGRPEDRIRKRWKKHAGSKV